MKENPDMTYCQKDCHLNSRWIEDSILGAVSYSTVYKFSGTLPKKGIRSITAQHRNYFAGFLLKKAITFQELYRLISQFGFGDSTYTYTAKIIVCNVFFLINWSMNAKFLE